ncbi:hypothetical protein RJT34_25254 [Clitoria ternatea]|uniref:Ubiquitin-like domain-containing protein n=1 Tax=Clitoria ternatea TaxID=43366 RepID=A0AAN9IIC0_CLITE
MEIIVDVVGGYTYIVEISPSETVLAVKRKLSRACRVNATRRNLLFNGRILPNNEIIPLHPNFVNRSRFQLQPRQRQPQPPPQLPEIPDVPSSPEVEEVPEQSTSENINASSDERGKKVVQDELPEYQPKQYIPPQQPPPPPPRRRLMEDLRSMPPPPPPSRKITLRVKVPKVDDRIGVEIDMRDTVKKLKEKILEHEEMKGVEAKKMVLLVPETNGVLFEHKLLQDCGVSDSSEIDVVVENLRVMVLPMDTDAKIGVDVCEDDNVEVLRKKLETFRYVIDFHLPEDGRYFFVHKQNVMKENMSFKSHNVQQGDTIETFEGIAPGSS